MRYRLASIERGDYEGAQGIRAGPILEPGRNALPLRGAWLVRLEPTRMTSRSRRCDPSPIAPPASAADADIGSPVLFRGEDADTVSSRRLDTLPSNAFATCGGGCADADTCSPVLFRGGCADAVASRRLGTLASNALATRRPPSRRASGGGCRRGPNRRERCHSLVAPTLYTGSPVLFRNADRCADGVGSGDRTRSREPSQPPQR